ncbi:hypothetical protein [Flavisericum labens]|uniref:hypothetical protein n=1 Tax=Flavisericum labens TaxID=3377112 RepID=UPI00387B1CC0
MKAIVLLLVVFFTANLGNSQNVGTDLLALNTEEMTSETTEPSTKAINSNYKNEVVDNSMAIHVSVLEERVSKFDVTSVPEYKGKSEPFKVKFKTDKGYIEVLYGKNGEILKTKERFKQVKLPSVVRDNVLREFSKCKLVSSDYLVWYDTKRVKKIYKITILQNNSKKKIKITADGEFI